jgi:hypothetical protein
MPMPWKAYGELRGLKAPPRRKVAPASLTCWLQENLLAAFDRAWAGHDGNLIAADADAVVELDDGALGAEGAARQLVGRADAMDAQYAGQQLVLFDVQWKAWADAGQDGLGGAGGRWTLTPASIMRSMMASICSSVACSCIATIIACSPSRATARLLRGPGLAPGHFPELLTGQLILLQGRMTSMMRSKMWISSISGNGPLLAWRECFHRSSFRAPARRWATRLPP